MKRVKIMLTAICVFAVIGGALAFKVKTFGTKSYCTKVNSGDNICTSFVTNATFAAGTPALKYTLTSNTANCDDGDVECPKTGKVDI